MADPQRYGVHRIEAYRIAHALALRIESMVDKLPVPDRFDRGDQAKRSSGSVPAQIVEGYGLRKYKDQFLLYLHRALASADETKEHVDHLFEAGKLKNAAEYVGLEAECRKLSAKLGAFICGVERNHSLPYYLRSDSLPKATPGKQKRNSRRSSDKSGLAHRRADPIRRPHRESRTDTSESGPTQADLGSASLDPGRRPHRESRIKNRESGTTH